MKSLDTNVILRFILHDDAAQSSRASAAIREALAQTSRLFIADIVMAEVEWVLEDCYHFDREQIVQVLDSLLRTAQFAFEDIDRLYAALDRYRQGRADFSDYLIGETAKTHGFDTTLTFDKGLKDENGFELLTVK